MNIFHFPVSATATSLINICRDIFITYGVPTTLASDGGPQFIAHSFQQFLKKWDVYHKKSSAGYAQSNGRAEAAVKTAKRILSDNIASDGSINNDNVAKAMLQYRNTPLPFLNLSPAQLLFHRELRDFLPRPISAYQLHESWVQQAKQREALFAKRNEKIAERYNKTAHELQPLPVGSKVLVQNKRNYRRGKWDRSGKIMEVLSNRQYHVKLDGSGRVTLQNRRFIREVSIPQLSTTNDFRFSSISAKAPDTTVQAQGGGSSSSSNAQVQDGGHSHSSVNGAPLPSRPSQPLSSVNSNPLNTVRQATPLVLRRLNSYNSPGLREDATLRARQHANA